MNSAFKRLAFLFLLSGLISNSLAHGDIHERIQKLSQLIKAHKDSADLYLRRGKLFAQHEEYDFAKKDFLKCQSLKYSSIELNYEFSKVYIELNEFQEAINLIKPILEKDPYNIQFLKERALIHTLQNEHFLAATLYSTVLSHIDHANTNNYIAAADSWLLSPPPDSLSNAIKILKEGNNSLGAVPIIQERLLMVFERNNMYPEMLEILNSRIENLKRNESDYALRGKVYMKLNETIKAKEDFQQCLYKVSTLDPTTQKKDEIIQLQKEVNTLIDTL